MARVSPSLDAQIAHLAAVRAVVRAELEARAARVQAVVDSHVRTGRLRASLRVETNATDATVSIAHPEILAINYGHTAANGRFVEGIHAIEAGQA
ncbi:MULTISPECIES: DUF5403 family protein [unclassified Streptomyces]|uniref:DUF5403 family protein n=1 Tax=unclassified Streptomyces TaxID=2593676 RepID=UPI0004768D7F|nr:MULTISPECIES: DUF5403 family protein [unclassified Streptomyces]MYT30470.1 hypothetical protein [Streptomyces sp. SID8354]